MMERRPKILRLASKLDPCICAIHCRSRDYRKRISVSPHIISVPQLGVVSPVKSATRTYRNPDSADATIWTASRQAGSNWATGPLGITPLQPSLGPDPFQGPKTRSNTSGLDMAISLSAHIGPGTSRRQARSNLISSALPVNRWSGDHGPHGPGKQRAGFATTLSRVHNRTQCIFLTLHSRNVWSAPKGTRVLSTRKHGVVYSLTAVPNGWNAPAHTQSSTASSLPSLRRSDSLY